RADYNPEIVRATRRVAIFSTLFALLAAGALAQPAEAIRYTVRFPAPQSHYVEVDASVPTGGRPSVELMMAVWTPGSYLVREYERHVEGVTATAAGRVQRVEKTAKNRWRVATGGADRVAVSYRVFAHEATVRSNWVDADFAMLNGAPTYLTLVDSHARPHDVQLELPAAWKTSITGLADAPDGRAHHYLAPDYDTLVDSPIVAGNPVVRRFDVDGTPHFLVDVGRPGRWDGERAAADVARIVRTQRAFWGSLPYTKYVFFNVLNDGGGAIEHKNSVMMMSSRWAMATRARYLAWLSTTSHEFFHLWNVKRLRPVELGPFDYEHEVHTRSLWIAEGLTDYYADVLLARAGLISEDEYYDQLSAAIKTLQTTPGRLVQTAELASYDAWIKEYRPDENSTNVSISYYTKGAVLGFVLDAEIRRRTSGRRSLDDVMRLAFHRYSGAHGYTPDEFRKTASEVAGADLGAWFTRALETTEEVDYTPALEWYGLRFEPAEGGAVAEAWLGARTRIENNRLLVEIVPRETPAWRAGLNVGDEIVAIEDFRVRADQLDDRLKAYKPGEKVSVLVARRDEMRKLDVTLGAAPRDTWQLEPRSGASAEQQAHRASLLAPPR
ncbi:MAG TPA: PDZ domain-containing protein, partial [Vicinamibacterales bacterium]